MGTLTTMPPVPGPPHDPYWWLLDGRAGWHAQELVGLDVDVLHGGLRLALEPGSGRFLAETSGCFGGLTLPRHVTWGPEGTLYLLDGKTARLKVFDACECRFVEVPCLGGKGDDAREFSNPRGIMVRGATLYVCDTQNHRLALFSLRGFLLRAEWRPIPDANLDLPWEPYDIAFDNRGLAYVCDVANHAIHRFDRHGHWLGALTGHSQPSAVALDRENRLYVLEMSPQPHVVRSMLDGTDRTVLERPAEVADAFPALPVTVDSKGRLDLGALCGLPHAWFDTDGEPIRDCDAQSLTAAQNPVFRAKGHCLSGPLDSDMHQCRWHRVVLQGSAPTGTRIRVKTYTAETHQPPSHIMALGEEVWKTRKLWTSLRESPWDCLINSHPGRFLWLKLEFESNGQATPEVRSMRIEFPRISLRRHLPAVFGEDQTGADFTDRFLSLFDTTLRTIESQIDDQAALLDPMATPAEPGHRDFLNWLAGWLGLTLDRQWHLAKRRLLVKRAADHFGKRGTRSGLHELLALYMGMEPENICCVGDAPRRQCSTRPPNCAPEPDDACHWRAPPLILEHYQLRRWLFLCEGRLGEQAVLWGRSIVNRSQLDEGARLGATQLITTQDPLRDPFHAYAHKFSVFVPACFGRTEHHKRALRNIIESEKPAHTLYQLVYVEPRFRIGFQSCIGLDAVVGRYPEGVTLDGTPLGRATVLGAPANKRGGPSLEIGLESRVGLTTRLN